MVEAVILPCPFCGRPARIAGRSEGVTRGQTPTTLVWCDNPACGPQPMVEAVSSDIAIQAWNTRAPGPRAATGGRIADPPAAPGASPARGAGLGKPLP